MTRLSGGAARLAASLQNLCVRQVSRRSAHAGRRAAAAAAVSSLRLPARPARQAPGLPGPSQAAAGLLGSVRGLQTVNNPKSIKRFYKDVAVGSCGDDDTSWQILLDGKAVKTPKHSPLHLPTKAVAEAVAAEWDAQVEKVKPTEMPLTTMGCTAVDIVKLGGLDACVGRLLPFLQTDTICFEDDHEKLVDLQRKEWGPVRQWFEDRFNVQLGIATGLGVPNHPEGTVEPVQQHLETLSVWDMCALEIATDTCKSLIVALALMERADVAPEDAFRWALLEEHFQIERWGLVEGEHDVAHEDILNWLKATRHFAELCKQPE
eukprot:TRINITY_DN103989_c0_g1_i1.p1 TRINITY_DN103989_c0_g1~~TRINITY_DN103989_c0_g1_i1.p1  ORF type:complete len:320 (-),score=72.31 TRINITY_DN103989_c0_g1_i1:161-1120(-)